MSAPTEKRPPRQVLAGFAEVHAFEQAVEHFAGDPRWTLETFTPHPLESVQEHVAPGSSPIPQIVFFAFIAGALGGFGMQAWASVYSYPLNVGGRPLLSWPAFLPVTFELGVLTAALVGLITLCIRQGWPKLYLPELDSALITRSSQDIYVLRMSPSEERWEKDLGPLLDELRASGAIETEVMP